MDTLLSCVAHSRAPTHLSPSSRPASPACSLCVPRHGITTVRRGLVSGEDISAVMLDTIQPAHTAFRRHAWLLRATLLGTALLDELTSGFPVVALPLLRDRLHLTYAQAGLLFTAGALSSLLLEPVINLLADRGPKRPLIAGGMLALVCAFVVLGVASTYAVVLLGFIVFYPATGAAVGISQAALVDAQPASAARTMARWTFLSGVGDLLSPLAVALLLAAGEGWPAICVLGTVVWLAALAGMLFLPFTHERMPFGTIRAEGSNAPDAPLAQAHATAAAPGVIVGLRAALRDLALLRWAGVVLLCGMVDEIFLGFAALFLRDHLHASAAAVTLMILAGSLSALVGVAGLDRLLVYVSGSRLLPWLALVALVAMVAFVFAPGLWLAAPALCLLDLAAAGWYPIAQAAAYGCMPGRSGTVRTVIALGAPFEVVLPGIVGMLAARFGITAGVAFLGLAPLGVLLLAPRSAP